jgi:16S rRNA (cytosine967-C5)-methyltransferase
LKLYRPLCQACTDILQSIFTEGYYADKAIEYAFKNNRKWGSRDRKFIAENVYEIVRWWRKIRFIQDREESDINPEQLQQTLGLWLSLSVSTLPDWLGIKENEIQAFRENWDKRDLPEAVWHSIPDWLFERLQEELGESLSLRLKALNQPARVYLRVNTLKTDKEKLTQILAQEDIHVEPVDKVDSALVLNERKNVFVTEAFKAGLFEVQDAGSQLLSTLLMPEPGSRVIDACAGAGGKSLHLASLMNNKGRIIALDIEEYKLGQLHKRAKRAGVDTIEIRHIDSSKVYKRLQGKADYLLLDVPCSGLGVLKRNPDSKWKLSTQRIAELIEIQRDILTKYSKMLKPGGKMLYATCSILPSENEKQIQWFLDSTGDRFELISEWHSHPEETGFDGFYAAVIKG